MRAGHDERHMRRALELAERGLGRTSPNPVVGCVLVARDGSVAGEGFHEAAGLPHAEVVALAEAGEAARAATLYVTLEPCCVHGRTPPCTEAIVASDVARVVVATRDPNPSASGSGLERLRQAGIEVTEGVLATEAARQNEVFFKWITAGLPFVTAKWAMSLDGRIARPAGTRTVITGRQSQRRVHELRAASDAVMTGSATVLADDPELTVRLAQVRRRQPLRVVLDSSCTIPATSKVVSTAGEVPTLVATTEVSPETRRKKLASLGVEVVVLPSSQGRVDLHALLGLLGEREITSVLLEAGGRLTASMFEAGLVDKVIAFAAPLLLAGGPGPIEANGNRLPPLRLEGAGVERLGEDVLVTGYPRRA